MAGWPRARIGAITIDLLGVPPVMDAVADALSGAAPPTVLASVNLDHIHHFASSAQPLPSGVRDGVRWLALLDGRPVVSAVRRRARWLQPAAVPGCELLDPVLRLAATRGARLGLVGGSETTRAFWAQVLPGRLPGLVMAGVWPVNWADLDRPGGGRALAAQVTLAAPDILVVSLGKPRQELWLRDHLAATGAKLALPFGSAVDYVAGTAQRPPAWARQAGLEWLVRLAREPRRLSRRYLIDGPPALARLWLGLQVDQAGP